jgi:hypothetical protein
MKTEIVISETEPRGDLTESIARVLGDDGEHVVYDDKRRKLVANVSNSKVVEWAAFDEDGSEVTTVVIRQPAQTAKIVEISPGASRDARRARWAIVCACFESGDRCWWQPY